MAVLFISETALKTSSYISDAVDVKVITPTIEVCQDMYILPILGTALYTDLKAAIQDDATLANNALYKTLLDTYIVPCLTWYVVSEVNDPNSYKIMNKGVVKKQSDNAAAASLSEIIRLIEKYKNWAQWYGERLIKYLQQNQASYPKYLNQGPNAGIDTIYPKVNSYQTGLSLGDCTMDETDLKWSYGYPWREK